MENMQARRQKYFSLFDARHLLPLVLLILSLLVTYQLWQSATRIAEQSLAAEFGHRVQELNDRLYLRMRIYQQVLRGTLGLYVASGNVTREDFHKYIETLKIQENYPGIEGIGFSLLIPAEEKEKHELSLKQAGFPEYRIAPAGERPLYTSIVYLEPFSGRNLSAFGYDMYSEPRRRAAMEQARDSGNAAISDKVILVQETEADVQAGFLMYLPVYHADRPHETLLQRRTDLTGWVYAPFRMHDLMQEMQGAGTGDFDIEIYDGDQMTAASLMYDSNAAVSALRQPGRLTRVERIVIGDHHWQMVVTALPVFEREKSNDRAGLILRSGIGISLLLSLLIWVFLDDRARAIQAASQAMHLALYDALTGLPNRKLIMERLSQAIARARRDHSQVAVLFIDLDRFKPVNDEYGHAIGDLLLKQVAKRLQDCMRESDTVARLGGDEFVALLAETTGQQSIKIAAAKILHALTQPFEVAGHRLEIAASLGAAVYPEHGEDPNALLKSADLAMYDAKNSGRSAIRFAT